MIKVLLTNKKKNKMSKLLNKFLKRYRIPKAKCYFFVFNFVMIFLFFFLIVNINAYSIKDEEPLFKVPKILHQTGKFELLHPITKTFHQDCKETYEKDGWTVKFWTDDEIYDFVKSKFPVYWDEYSRMKPKIKQIDAFRYLLMYYYGGIYLDLDAECVRPASNFVDGLAEGSTFYSGGYMEPFFMMSTKGNMFAIYAFEQILKDWPKYSVRSTGGPQGLQRIATNYVKDFGVDAVRLFEMNNQEECDLIQPQGDVKCGEKTWRWVTGEHDFKPSHFHVHHKLGFIPNQIIDPTACKSTLGDCMYKVCRDRERFKGALFIHKCHYAWRKQGH